MKLDRLDNTMHFEDIDINAIRQMLWKNEEDRLFGKNVTKQQDNPEFHPIKRGANDKTVFQETARHIEVKSLTNLFLSKFILAYFDFYRCFRILHGANTMI